MKKYISLLVFSLCAFFLFGFNIKALDFNINFDKHEHFNFFYEMKENTPFYRYLISQGTGLFDTLQDYYSDSTGRTDKPLLLISYLSDVSSTFSSNVVVPDNSYYVISAYYGYKSYWYNFGTGIASNSTESTNTYTSLYYNSSSSLFSIKYNARYGSTSVHGDMVSLIYYFYDSNSNFLGYYLNPIINGDTSTYSFDYYNFNNFEYLLSSLYYSSDSVFYSSNSSPSLRLNKIIVDGEEYYLKNYETMSGWTQFWKRLGGFFTGVGLAEATDYSLDYFRINYFISDNVGFPGLLKSMTDFNNSVIVPSGYLSALFNLTDNVTLYPKTSCSLEDLALYVYSGSLEEKTFNLYLHSNSATDELGYQGSYYSTYNFVSNGNIKIDPLNFVVSSVDEPHSTIGEVITDTPTSVHLTSSDFTNYYYRLARITNFGITRVYYNTDCYVAQIGSESVLWTNPLSGNEISVDSSFRDWSDPQNIDSGNSVPFQFNLSDLIVNAWNNSKTFIMGGVEIVSLSTVLFNELPDEVSSIILFAFVLGIYIILISLIKHLK